MNIFFKKELKQLKSDLLPYIKKNKIMTTLFIAMVYLVIDTNIQVRRMETKGIFKECSRALDNIEQDINSLKGHIEDPFGQETDIKDIQYNTGQIETRIKDIQEKIDDLWFKL